MDSGDLIAINLDGASTHEPDLRFCLLIKVNYINEKVKKRRDNWSPWADLTILYQGYVEKISLYWDDEVEVL